MILTYEIDRKDIFPHCHKKQFFITLWKTNLWTWGGTCQAPGPWRPSSCLSGKAGDAETREEQPGNNSAGLSQSSGSASVQFSSVPQLCRTLHDPMDCSTPGLPVHHQLPEFTQTHLHWVGDAIQPSHPLSSPSPPALNLSQHQGLFQWVSSSHQVAEELEFQLQQ